VPDFLDYSIKFKNSFEWGEYEEPWNLPPSDELDAAWDQLVFGEIELVVRKRKRGPL
jgi:hypothetical protein